MATTLSLIDSLSRTQQQTNKRTHECNVSMPYVISMQNTSLIHKYQSNLHFTLHSSLKLNSSLYLRLQKKCSDLFISHITGWIKKLREVKNYDQKEKEKNRRSDVSSSAAEPRTVTLGDHQLVSYIIIPSLIYIKWL